MIQTFSLFCFLPLTYWSNHVYCCTRHSLCKKNRLGRDLNYSQKLHGSYRGLFGKTLDYKRERVPWYALPNWFFVYTGMCSSTIPTDNASKERGNSAYSSGYVELRPLDNNDLRCLAHTWHTAPKRPVLCYVARLDRYTIRLILNHLLDRIF